MAAQALAAASRDGWFGGRCGGPDQTRPSSLARMRPVSASPSCVSTVRSVVAPGPQAAARPRPAPPGAGGASTAAPAPAPAAPRAAPLKNTTRPPGIGHQRYRADIGQHAFQHRLVAGQFIDMRLHRQRQRPGPSGHGPRRHRARRGPDRPNSAPRGIGAAPVRRPPASRWGGRRSDRTGTRPR